ncbi:DoxX family protein [Jhaorihella thermophila]|uniref:Putative oxidoreductase n=1 Tax=Jhaorihella thermophila TaxID=488547 RepID=A0A1H5T3M3_9RHOB|nr:DoxX family protein [Jhaorihella thermophila]SEF57512.1 putative oxidoreductase [Jhaorihella thermophila]
MRALIGLHDALFDRLATVGDWLMPLFARFVFAATLLVYYWASAVTKLGDGILGILSPSVGAYAQIFPRQFEAVGYDSSQLTLFHWAVVTAGTLAEFILPALIVIGLATRLAALGMIGFVLVQSLTDYYGHGLTDPATVGRWFDRLPDGVLLDQRLFWVFLLTFIMVRGAGVFSIDAALRRRTSPLAA